MKKLSVILLLVLMDLFTSSMNAQNYNYVITTLKEKFYGDSMWIKKDSLCLNNDIATKCISTEDIISYSKFKDDRQRMALVCRTYNSYGIVNQTAYGQKKGTMMFRNFLVFDNSLGYGVTDNVSVQFGNTIFSANALESPFTPYLALKTSIPIWKNKINIGGRVSYQRASSYDSQSYSNYNSTIFTYSGILTLGSPDNNVNVNYTIENYKFIGNVKMLSIGGKCKLKYRTSFILESIIFNGSTHSIALGLRSDFKKGCISYGVFTSTDDEYLDLDGVLIPYFGAMINF